MRECAFQDRITCMPVTPDNVEKTGDSLRRPCINR